MMTRLENQFFENHKIREKSIKSQKCFSITYQQFVEHLRIPQAIN